MSAPLVTIGIPTRNRASFLERAVRSALAQEAVEIEVVVSDTGIGIDPQYHEMIFRELAQVDSSRARRHHGTGLGLAIARNFIQLHGGEIWVESELGAGSTFYFRVPKRNPESQIKTDVGLVQAELLGGEMAIHAGSIGAGSGEPNEVAQAKEGALQT